MTVRMEKTRPGMTSLTNCQANQTSMNNEKPHSWTWHGITHMLLSSQQGQNGHEDNEMEDECICYYEITYSLSSQQY